MTKARKMPPSPQADSSQMPRTEPRHWQMLALLAGMALVFFRDILLGNAFLWEDFLFYSYPVRNFAATSMAMGQIPLWNPYTFAGMPFLADIQTAVFYLPCTVLALAVTNGSLSFRWLEFVIVLHYAIAGTGMYFLALSFRLRRFPALFAGAAFMLSGFMIAHAIHQQIITLVSWYPLVILLFRKALTEQRWLWVFAAALVLGHSIFAGYPQLSLYLYFFLLVYFLFELLNIHRGKELLSRPALLMVARAAAVVLLSVAIAMVQLLPTMELADLSQRAQITYEKACEGSLAWSQMMTLILPKAFGSAGANAYVYYGPGTYWYYWETCIYLGALPLTLMLFSLPSIRKDRHIAFFWGVAIIVLLYSLGNNFFLHRLFYDFVPGFSKFRNPARTGIFLSLAAALLSAFSLHHLLYGERNEHERRQLKKILAAVVASGLVVWIVIVSGSLTDMFPFMKNPRLFAPVKADANLSALVWCVSCAVVFTLISTRSPLRWAGWGLPLLFFIDMLVFGGEQNNSRINPSEYFHQSDPLVQFIKKRETSELFRVNTRHPQGMLMDRNQGMISRIFMMEGYTPLALERVYAPIGSSDKLFDILNVKYKTVFNEQSHSLAIAEHPTAFPRAFFVYGFKVAHGEHELTTLLQNPEFDHRRLAVLEKDPGFTLPDPQQQPAWNTRITDYRNNRIVLEAETAENGLLVVSEIFFPGWRATVDGEETEVFRADYSLRGLFVPAGTHVVELNYAPSSFARGSLITLGALLLCAGGGGISWFRSKKGKD